MRTTLGMLSSMLLLDCGIIDARAGEEDEAAAPRYALARLMAPVAAGSAPEPPLLRVDCNDQRRRECVRFCAGQYPVTAAAQRCIRGCTRYCTSCSADRRRQCRAN